MLQNGLTVPMVVAATAQEPMSVPSTTQAGSPPPEISTAESVELTGTSSDHNGKLKGLLPVPDGTK